MRIHPGVALIAGAWAVSAAVACGAQSSPSAQSKPSDNPAPCSVAPEPAPCGTSPVVPGKSAAQKFPFPGQANGIGPSSNPASPSLSGVPDAPDAPNAAAAPDTNKKFPFPGEAAQPDAPAESSSSSSSSSSSGDDPSPIDPDAKPALKDGGSEGSPATPGRHILHRVNPVGTKLQSNDEREQEDLDVAKFYVGNGDLQGAYLRGQDAVKTAPDDPDAHFALAEIALKLNKRDEAIAEYSSCLKLDPDDKEAREARKALAKLKP